MEMPKVYELVESLPNPDENYEYNVEYILGRYSSRENAEKAIERWKTGDPERMELLNHFGGELEIKEFIGNDIDWF